MNRTVLLHCNAGGRFGMGHLMRSIAIAETAIEEGWHVSMGGDIAPAGLDILGRLLPSVTAQVFDVDSAAAWIRDTAAQIGPDVIHVDSYWLSANATDGANTLVSNMRDGQFGNRRADLTVDGNIRAEAELGTRPPSGAAIMGAPGIVIRRQVLQQRGRWSPSAQAPRVLIVIGGTDPYGFTIPCLRAIADLPLDLEITVVCRPDQLSSAQAIAALSSRSIVVRTFVEDLPALAASNDLVVTAAGTSVWDLACLGVPMALVCVTENQHATYRTMVEAGLAIGLGSLTPHAVQHAGPEIVRILTDLSAMTATSERLRALVDGHGAWRVVASWAQLHENRKPQPSSLRLVAEGETDSASPREDRGTVTLERSGTPVAVVRRDGRGVTLRPDDGAH